MEIGLFLIQRRSRAHLGKQVLPEGLDELRGGLAGRSGKRWRRRTRNHRKGEGESPGEPWKAGAGDPLNHTAGATRRVMTFPARPGGGFAQNWSWSVCRPCRSLPSMGDCREPNAALLPADLALLKTSVRHQHIPPIGQRVPDPLQRELDVEIENPGVWMGRCPTGTDVILDARAKKQ